MNQNAAADKIDAERLALWEGQPAEELANLALAQTSSGRPDWLRQDPSRRQGRSVRDLDLDLAAANLKLAITRGFTDMPMLRSRPESPILLERDDIKPLDRATSNPARRPPASQRRNKSWRATFRVVAAGNAAA